MTDKEIDELFVRKDLYDANSARLEALMRATVAESRQALAEHKAVVEGLRSEVSTWNTRFETSFEAMNKRVDDIQHRLNRSFMVMSLIFAGVGFIIALPTVLNSLIPAIERLIKLW